MLESVLVAGVLVFLAGMAYKGNRKGLIRIGFSVLSIIAAMFLSQCLAVPVSNFIENNTSIHQTLKSQMDKYVESTVKEEIDNAAGQVQENIIETLSIAEPVKSILFKDYQKPDNEVNTDELCEYISEGLTEICMRAITTLVLFLVITLVLRSSFITLTFFEKLPLIKEINKLAGAAIGVAEGIVILWILCIVLMAATGTPAADTVMEAVDNNVLLSLIYDTNVFLKLFGTLLR